MNDGGEVRRFVYETDFPTLPPRCCASAQAQATTGGKPVVPVVADTHV